MKVLLLAINLDGNDVGEVATGFELVRHLADRVELTVLALQHAGVVPLAEQLPGVEVQTWPEPEILQRHERLNAMAKLGWPVFTRHVRRWLAAARAEGRHFDLAHHFLPRAPRYAPPLRGQGIPYVIGPVGGSLPTPPGFAAEVGTGAWFARLRAADTFRFRHDPWLRRGYGDAELVLGVAPYMREVLADLPIRRYDSFLGIGIGDLPELPARKAVQGQLALLHVGRAVRTKGLRDVIRALGHLRDLPAVTLTSIGDGEDLAPCRAEVARLGLEERVRFLGRLPRAEIERWYASSDALAFPSFRESMGGVLYEAQRWALPIVTVRAGGPDWIVDDTCGLKVDVTDPETMARHLADAIRVLALNPELRARLGQGAREKVSREGLWEAKAGHMYSLYEEVLATGGAAGRP